MGVAHGEREGATKSKPGHCKCSMGPIKYAHLKGLPFSRLEFECPNQSFPFCEGASLGPLGYQC